jgi:hypothetical protein
METSKEQCGYIEIAGQRVMVHRYDVGTYMCRCGSTNHTPRIEDRGGWRQPRSNNAKSTGFETS